MISLKQLHYATAVDRTRHFKKAADECAISQSALSTAISELESQLGFQVFERNNKQVLVTSLGEQLLERARDIMQRVEGLSHLSDQNKAPLSMPFSLGVIPTIGPYLLPKVLPRVRKELPESQISVVEEQSHVLVEQVRTGQLDAAILALPYAVDGLHAFEFWEENFYLVAHREDNLAKLKTVAGTQLKGSHLLLLKDGHCLKDHALAACKLSSSETDGGFSGTSLYTLVQMVAGRMGTTLVPEMGLEQLVAQDKDLVSVPLADPGPHRRLAFITRLNYAGIHNIEYLKELFRSELSAQLGRTSAVKKAAAKKKMSKARKN